MHKKWTKDSDFRYTFWVDEEKAGEMDIQFNKPGKKAVCSLGTRTFTIKRTGFWKSRVEITGSDGQSLMSIYPEKWYAHSSVIDGGDKKYKLVIRNNPLAEYAITENGMDILAYGLATNNKKLNVRISSPGNPDYLFDFILWYLFLPVADENFGDDYSFLLLTATA